MSFSGTMLLTVGVVQLELRHLAASINRDLSLKVILGNRHFFSTFLKLTCVWRLLTTGMGKNTVPLKLFCRGFKILQLRSWRGRRVQYVVQIAVCIQHFFFACILYLWLFSLFCNDTVLTKGWIHCHSLNSLDKYVHCINGQKSTSSDLNKVQDYSQTLFWFY